MTLQELDRRLQEWHRRKYNGKPPDPDRTFRKTVEEVGELAEALNGKDEREVGAEAADVVFTLFHLTRGSGVDLIKAMEQKLWTIEQRLEKTKAAK